MGGVRILCGPKRSGRSAAMDALILEHWPAAFVISPNAAHQRLISERILLDGGQPGAWGKRIAAFPQFVEELLASYGEHARRLGEFERVRLMQRLIDELADDPALTAAGPSAATRGFRNQVLKAIVELKQAAIEPQEFHQALARLGTPPPHRKLLATLYERYQQALLDHGVFDTVGRYWRARVLVDEKPPPLLEGVRLLVLDGFDDFTPSELRLIKALAAHVETTAFALAFDPEDAAQQTLHGLLHGTLGRLQRAFSDAEVAAFPEAAPETTAQFAARHAFSIEDPPDPGTLTPALAFVPCGSAGIERDHLARRVKCLLVDEGVPAGRIAVCVANLNQHLAPLRQAFEAAGIPFRLRDTRTVAEGGAARFVSEVLRAIGSWSTGDVLSVLGSPWLDASLGFEGRRHAPLIARKAFITGGREQWPRRLAWYEGTLLKSDGTHPDLKRYPGLLPALAGVKKRLEWLTAQGEAIAASGTEPVLASALTDLLVDAAPGGMLQALSNAQRPAETAALRALLEALGRARQQDGAGPVRDAAAWFEDLCAYTQFDRGGPGMGVTITDPEGLRHLSFQWVLFAGLNEGVLPGKRPADALLSDHEREELRAQGLALVDREHHAHLEMSLFHRALEVAEERVELSWSMADADGRERFQSPFVQELQRLAPDAERFEPIAAMFPPEAQAATPREVLGTAFGDGPALAPVAKALDAGRFLQVERGARIEENRYRTQGFDAHDGVLAHPASMERLAARFGSKHSWSAAQFETYNACPLKFFLQYVLRVEEPREPKEELEPLVRGGVVHRVLERFLQDHPTRRLDTLGEADGERIDRAVDEVFEARDHYPEIRCIPPGILRAERARMKEELRRFVIHSAATMNNSGWVATEFELAFGGRSEAYDPFPLALEDETIQVSGVIDRVDCNAEGQARLIDYKTGTLPAVGDLNEAEALQLGLYALAWEQYLRPGTPCAEAFYVKPSTAEVRDALEAGRGPGRGERTETMLARIEEIVHAVRCGRFPPIVSKNGKLHAFKRAVRHEEGRIERKAKAMGI